MLEKEKMVVSIHDRLVETLYTLDEIRHKGLINTKDGMSKEMFEDSLFYLNKETEILGMLTELVTLPFSI